MALQPDGKIILAGESRTNNISDFTLVRYNNGTKDAIMDFNGDGKTDWAITRSTSPGTPYTWYIRNNG